MEFALFIFVLVILFALAAWRWGADSREKDNGSDWHRLLPVYHRA